MENQATGVAWNGRSRIRIGKMVTKCVRVAIATMFTIVGRHRREVYVWCTATRSRLLGGRTLRHSATRVGDAMANLMKSGEVVGVEGLLYDCGFQENTSAAKSHLVEE